jgi:hypothetical protein
MKTTSVSLALLLTCTLAQADIIAQWNFNSPVPDANTSTGTSAPARGNGTAALLGSLTATFSTGCTNDPAPDNSGWNTASYPAQGTSNELGGVQFNVSTLGYSGIAIRWDQRVSSTASKYYRLQYSSDGAYFMDFYQPNIMQAVSSSSSYYESQTNDLGFCADLNDCAGFTFRIVSEFESSALGAGADGFVTTYGTNNYSRAGTVRFDMVTVTGTPIPGANTPPHVTAPPDQVLRVGQLSAPLVVTVSDAEDTPEDLMLEAHSSNPQVLADTNISLQPGGSQRALRLLAADQPGTAVVTLWVIDTGSRSNSASFSVSVLPLNTPPFLSPLAATNTLADTPAPPILFSVGDLESAAGDLQVSAISANPTLVPNDAAHIAFGGAGSNRTLVLLPASHQTGVAPIRLSVTDGAALTSGTFALLVVPSAQTVFYDPFAYPDGSLLTNSGFLWKNRSGTDGECQVTNGALQLAASQTEDVIAPLIGAPYAKSNHTVLYASFKARFLTWPRAVPGLWAHFADGSTLRGRIYAGTTNAEPGSFWLFVSNGSDTLTRLPLSFTTNTDYTLVTRYDLDATATTLWVNPTTETDAATSGSDIQTAVPIASYGFRQDSDIGATVLVDDLRVGLSFEAVMPTTPVLNSPIPISINRVADSVVLRWTNSAFALQAGPGPAGPFTNVPGAANPYTNGTRPGAQFFRLRIP